MQLATAEREETEVVTLAKAAINEADEARAKVEEKAKGEIEAAVKVETIDRDCETKGRNGGALPFDDRRP
jgi:YbbR domain-containing protein